MVIKSFHYIANNIHICVPKMEKMKNKCRILIHFYGKPEWLQLFCLAKLYEKREKILGLGKRKIIELIRKASKSNNVKLHIGFDEIVCGKDMLYDMNNILQHSIVVFIEHGKKVYALFLIEGQNYDQKYSQIYLVLGIDKNLYSLGNLKKIADRINNILENYDTILISLPIDVFPDILNKEYDYT